QATDAEGRFEIAYGPEQFGDAEGFSGRGEAAADISFRVFDRSGREQPIRSIQALGREYRRGDIIFNAPGELQVGIALDAEVQGGRSEFERLVAAIDPVISEVPLTELTREDIAFLLNEVADGEVQNVREHIEVLRWCAHFGEATGLAMEAFYGWARTGTPELWGQLPPLDAQAARSDLAVRLLDTLAATEEEALVAALLRAVDASLIPAMDAARAKALARGLRGRLRATVEQMLQLQDEGSGHALAGYTVATRLSAAEGHDLGTDVTDGAGVFSVTVPAATGPEGTTALTFRIRGDGIADAVEVGLTLRPDADAVVPIRVTLPATGTTLGELRQDPNLSLSEAVLVTLADKHDIRSLADIRRKGGLFRMEAVDGLAPPAARRLDALADLERLAGAPDEMRKLADSRYASVQKIAESARDRFVGTMTAADVGIDVARATELHIAAVAQTEMLNQIFAGIAAEYGDGAQPLSGDALKLDNLTAFSVRR
ncbi:hypothetical protein, partial [Methylobacterium soli]